MKFYNTFFAPSINVTVRKDDHTLRAIELRQGEGSVSDEDMQYLLANESIRGFVEDGYLDFPACSVFGPLFGKAKAERIAREKVLFNAEEEAPDVTGDLAELSKLVGSQAQELSETKADYASVVEANKKMMADAEAMMARIEKMEKAATKAEAAPKAAPVAEKRVEAVVAAPVAAPVAAAPVVAAPPPVAAPVAAPPPPPAE